MTARRADPFTALAVSSAIVGRVALDDVNFVGRDLHGMTQADAHAALAHFLRRAQHDGARVVLVITGKGRAAMLMPSAAEH